IPGKFSYGRETKLQDIKSKITFIPSILKNYSFIDKSYPLSLRPEGAQMHAIVLLFIGVDGSLYLNFLAYHSSCGHVVYKMGRDMHILITTFTLLSFN
ncbi:hypothetical protein ACJX0J_027233, partial [Zea mays]